MFASRSCIAQTVVHSTDLTLNCENMSISIQFADLLCSCQINSARLITDGLTWDPSTVLRFIVPFHVLLCCLASSCFFLLSSSLDVTWTLRALKTNIPSVHIFSFHLSYTWTLRALRRTLCSQPRSDTVTTIARIAEITVHSTDFRLSCEHRWFCIQFANFLCDSHNNSARLITYGLS